MKHIEKQFKDQNPPEPLRFSAWKTQENSMLEPYYEANNADGAWSLLLANPPECPEEGIVYFTKKELLDNHLLQEQGYICAYCNRQIHNHAVHKKPALDFLDRRCSVEHIAEKSADARNRTFDYQNLVAVCRGGEKVPPPRYPHCDHKRSHKKSNALLPLHPLMPECEHEILYIYDGQIVGLTERANETIKILGLDNPVLKQHRETEIAQWIFDIDAEGQSQRISDEIANRRFIECTSKGIEQKYVECCGAILSVLKNEFNIQMA